MHRLRHDVVVEQWKWDVPGAADGLERDQFDTQDAVYLVLMGEPETRRQGRAVACSRLLPTTGPHMMSEVFADFCTLQPSPRGPDVWEYSRHLSDPTLFDDRAASKRARALITLALNTYCLDQGIRRLVWLTHLPMFNLAQQLWTTEPLGLPDRRDGADETLIAGVSSIDLSALQRTHAIYEAIQTNYDPLAGCVPGLVAA